MRQADRHRRRGWATARPVTGAVLIGADGLWSNVREQVVGDGVPRVTGHTTYRSVIPTERMPEDLRWNAATLWAGPKCHIVHYPLSGWKVFNLVVTYHNDAPNRSRASRWTRRRCSRASATSARARRHHPPRHATGSSGCCATATRWSAGSTGAWRCSATPRTRPCSTWRKARAWRWRTRSAWRTLAARPGRRKRAWRPIAAAACCAPRGRNSVARRWRAHLPPRRRACAAAQRHDVGQEPGGVARHSSPGSMAAMGSININELMHYSPLNKLVE